MPPWPWSMGYMKPLSTVIGHTSSATLDIYAHVTDEMRSAAARKIDREIGRMRPLEKPPHPGPGRPRPRRNSSPTGARGESRAQDVSPKSTTTCGRTATPQCDRTG